MLRNRSEYYRLLQHVRDKGDWTDWIVYNLRGVSTISQETKQLVEKMDELFREYKNIIRKNYKFYSHELINNIFSYPYTKAQLLQKDMNVSRATATRYLDTLAKDKLLEKHKIGNLNCYLNKRLMDILKNF